MGGIWHSKNDEIQVSSSSAQEGGNCGPETFVTPLRVLAERPYVLFCSIFPKILRHQHNHMENCCRHPYSTSKFFQICLSPASQIPQHVWAPRFFLDSVLAHSLVSVTYLAPRLAIWSRNYTLTLAFMLVQSKVWFLGFLSGTKYFAPRTPGPGPLLTWPT